jgi:hypothetical protein
VHSQAGRAAWILADVRSSRAPCLMRSPRRMQSPRTMAPIGLNELPHFVRYRRYPALSTLSQYYALVIRAGDNVPNEGV